MSPLTACIFFLAIVSLRCHAEMSVNVKCLIEHQIDWKDIRDLPPDSKKMKCYYFCKFAKAHVIVNGTYVGRHKSCAGVHDNNNCDLGYKLYMCRRSVTRP